MLNSMYVMFFIIFGKLIAIKYILLSKKNDFRLFHIKKKSNIVKNCYGKFIFNFVLKFQSHFLNIDSLLNLIVKTFAKEPNYQRWYS